MKVMITGMAITLESVVVGLSSRPAEFQIQLAAGRRKSLQYKINRSAVQRLDVATSI